MGSQVYSLKWNNYVTHVMSSFESLREDRDMVDVTLSCDGKSVQVHKVILSACSPYFRKIFKENPSQHPVIIFRNVAYEDLLAIVDFIYKGEVSVDQDQLPTFLHTAELLEIKGLANSGNSEPAKKSVPKEKKTYPFLKSRNSDVPASAEEPPNLPVEPLARNSPAPAKKRKLSEAGSSNTESYAEVTAKEASVVGETVVPCKNMPAKVETVDIDATDEDVDGPNSVPPVPEAVILSDDEDELENSDISSERSGAHNQSNNSGHFLTPSSSTSYAPNQASVIAHSSQSLPQKKPTAIKCDTGFRCSECNKVFARQNHCKSHIKVHLGETMCHLCGKTFPFVWNLKSHLEFHQGLTKCDICNKTLGDVFSLRAHIKRHFRQ